MILNTSEYCTNTTTQLEEKIQEMADEGFRSQISLATEMESFLNVSGVALQGLVRYVEHQLESCLTMMIRRSWSTIEAVGDQSDFINQIGVNITTIIQYVKKYLTSARVFKSFCDKLTEYHYYKLKFRSFMGKYYNNIYRCRPISTVGAEQVNSF